MAGILIQWRQAEANYRLAEDLRQQAETNFRHALAAVDKYFTTVSENQFLKRSQLEPLRRDLLQTAQGFYEQFVQERGADAAVQAELGKAYQRLAVITDLIGSKTQALEQADKARAIFDHLLQDDPGSREYQSQLAVSLTYVGDYAKSSGRLPQAEAALDQALALREQLARDQPNDPGPTNNLAVGHLNLGTCIT